MKYLISLQLVLIMNRIIQEFNKSHCVGLSDTWTDLEVHKDLVALYKTKDTAGATLTNQITEGLKDLILLSIANLRGQTYDGDANMIGIYRRCPALVREKQRRALHFHRTDISKT